MTTASCLIIIDVKVTSIDSVCLPWFSATVLSWNNCIFGYLASINSLFLWKFSRRNYVAIYIITDGDAGAISRLYFSVVAIGSPVNTPAAKPPLLYSNRAGKFYDGFDPGTGSHPQSTYAPRGFCSGIRRRRLLQRGTTRALSTSSRQSERNLPRAGKTWLGSATDRIREWEKTLRELRRGR